MALSFLGLNHLFVSPRLKQYREPEGKHKKQTAKKRITFFSKSETILSNKFKTSSPQILPLQCSFKSKVSNKSNKTNCSSETSDAASESNINYLSDESLYSLNSDSLNSLDSLNSFDSFDKKRTMYSMLRKQRNEAIKKTHKLENILKENDVQFALKCDQFNHQIKQYKYTSNRLQKENMKLKNELKILKEKLAYANAYTNASISLLQKRKKLSDPLPQIPQFVQKEYKTESHTNIAIMKPLIYGDNISEKNKEKNSLKPPNTQSHIRQLTTIMEHKQIPLGLLITNQKVVNIRDYEWNKGSDVARQRSITYV